MLRTRRDTKLKIATPEKALAGIVRLLARQVARECVAAAPSSMLPAICSGDTEQFLPPHDEE